MSGSDLLEKDIVVGLVNFSLVEYNDLSIQRTGEIFNLLYFIPCNIIMLPSKSSTSCEK